MDTSRFIAVYVALILFMIILIVSINYSRFDCKNIKNVLPTGRETESTPMVKKNFK